MLRFVSTTTEVSPTTKSFKAVNVFKAASETACAGNAPKVLRYDVNSYLLH